MSTAKANTSSKFNALKIPLKVINGRLPSHIKNIMKAWHLSNHLNSAFDLPAATKFVDGEPAAAAISVMFSRNEASMYYGVANVYDELTPVACACARLCGFGNGGFVSLSGRCDLIAATVRIDDGLNSFYKISKIEIQSSSFR